jgi:hypothetical protein
LSATAGSSGGAFEGAFIEIVVESWRLTRTFARLLMKLDAGESARFQNQLRFFQKRLEETLARTGLTLVNLEGQPYDTGMAASPLNIADFAPDDHLVVDQMVEPVIMGGNGIVRTGTMMLKRIPT